MQRDYNDGKWHGWNGGECPVHPESEVEGVYRSIVSRPYNSDTRPAKEWEWSAVSSNIIAFRVVKPYREPRVWWMIVDKWGDAKDAYPDKEDAERNSHYFSGPTIVRVVEQPE